MIAPAPWANKGLKRATPVLNRLPVKLSDRPRQVVILVRAFYHAGLGQGRPAWLPPGRHQAGQGARHGVAMGLLVLFR